LRIFVVKNNTEVSLWPQIPWVFRFFFLRDNFLFDLEHLQGSGLPQWFGWNKHGFNEFRVVATAKKRTPI
jgi:hypothetical protein